MFQFHERPKTQWCYCRLCADIDRYFVITVLFLKQRLLVVPVNATSNAISLLLTLKKKNCILYCDVHAATILRLLIATVFFFCSSFNNTILIVVLSKQWRRDSSRSAGDCRQTYKPCLLRWRCRGRDVDTLLVKHSTSGLCVWVAVSFFCVLHWINMFGFFVLQNIFDDYLFQESVTAQVNVEQMHIVGQK